MFLCRYAFFRIIITITVCYYYCISTHKKRLLRLASTAVITIVPLVLILVIIHCSRFTYCTVIIILLYHPVVYLEICLFCNDNTNRGVSKILGREKGHRLTFWVLLQQAYTCKSMSHYYRYGFIDL